MVRLLRHLLLGTLFVASAANASYNVSNFQGFIASSDAAGTIFPLTAAEWVFEDVAAGLNPQGWYNVSNGRFTPPINTCWNLKTSVTSAVVSVAAGDEVYLQIRVNGSATTGMRVYDVTDDPNTTKRYGVTVAWSWCSPNGTDYVSTWGDAGGTAAASAALSYEATFSATFAGTL